MFALTLERRYPPLGHNTAITTTNTPRPSNEWGLDGSASGERGKIYPNNHMHTIVEGRNLCSLSVCSVILNPPSTSWTCCKVFIY